MERALFRSITQVRHNKHGSLFFDTLYKTALSTTFLVSNMHPTQHDLFV